MKKCKIHDKVLTYRAGKKGELFCKLCERIKRKPQILKIEEKPKKKWWKFW